MSNWQRYDGPSARDAPCWVLSLWHEVYLGAGCPCNLRKTVKAGEVVSGP